MKTIDWYIIRKFLGTFFYSILLLSVIIIIFDLSEKIDDFVEKNAPLNKIIFSYYLNFLPFFINTFIALFTFISVIFFTSRMAANSEIVAILSSGISFGRLLRPYMISASVLALLSFLLAAYVIPVTNRKVLAFEKSYVKNPRRTHLYNLHMQVSPGVFIYVERYNDMQLTGYKFSMEKIRDQFLYYKLTSEIIRWDSILNCWKLENYQIRQVDSIRETVTDGLVLDTVFTLTPADFHFDTEQSKTLTLPQLNDKIAVEELKGSGTVVEFRVEKYQRFAYPFAAIILTLIGVSVSSRKVRGGTGLHLGIGLAIAFSYILFMQVFVVFGMYGDLPPLLATWVPNLLYGVLAFVLIRFTPK